AGAENGDNDPESSSAAVDPGTVRRPLSGDRPHVLRQPPGRRKTATTPRAFSASLAGRRPAVDRGLPRRHVVGSPTAVAPAGRHRPGLPLAGWRRRARRALRGALSRTGRGSHDVAGVDRRRVPPPPATRSAARPRRVPRTLPPVPRPTLGHAAGGQPGDRAL